MAGRAPAAPRRQRRAPGAAAKPAPARARKSTKARAGPLHLAELRELEALRARLERSAPAEPPPRWNADPEDVQRSVVRLVLTLVEFIRQLLERQAIRRMEAGTLSARETEDIGCALMQLEATVRDLAARFDLQPQDLNLELGPLGWMM